MSTCMCLWKNGQETLVYFGDMNLKAEGQRSDGGFIVHPLYF